MEKTTLAYFEKQKVLMTCVDLEVAAALIYKEFMDIFPSERAFWGQLAREEEDHARMYLAGDILNVTCEYAGIRFPPVAFINRSLAFAEQIQERIRTYPVTLKEALDMSLKLEQSLAESMVYDLPESDNPVIKNLKKIITDTESHLDRIEKARIAKGFSFAE